ncbi:MAG: hypothetical protein HQL95_12055, partial [Magnetococcales bacterium]|nr:hypothetical protein [Magnetococcales bacterium]
YGTSRASTLARLDRANVDATGSLTLTATSTAGINAMVLAGSAAVGAGRGGAITVSAAGVYAENRIYSSVDARIMGTDADQSTVAANGIDIKGESRASINAVAGAASLAASLAGGGSSISASIGLSLAFNSIDADVLARAEHAVLDAGAGGLTMRSISAGLAEGPTIQWTELQKAGITAAALDSAANANAKTSFDSDENRKWDYLRTDGLTYLKDGDLLLDYSGLIYEYTGDDATIDLRYIAGDNRFELVDDDTEETVKSGYTVRVDELHSGYAAQGDTSHDPNRLGQAGRVYRFIGGSVDHVTAEGKTSISHGQKIRVSDNFARKGFAGRVFEYIDEDADSGEPISIDLSTADYSDSKKWDEVEIEEDIELWKEDYTDTTRWELASEFADPTTVVDLRNVLIDAGYELAEADLIRPTAVYTSGDGIDWTCSTEDGTVDLKKDDLVLDEGNYDEDGKEIIYRYLGKDGDEEGKSTSVDLSKADFEDDDLWEKQDPQDKTMRKDDTVRLANQYRNGGVGGAVYQYIGKNNIELNLTQQDYSDTTNWQRVVPELAVSVIEPGKIWQIIDADGKSYTLTLDGQDVSMARNNINAISVAASAAIGLAAGGSGIAISGAGAVAVNRLSGSTDSLLRFSDVTATGNVTLSAANQSLISATIASLSIAVGAGTSAGVGASIGIAVARNLIGQEGFGAVGEDAIATVRALAEDTSIETAGDVTFTAKASQSIDALVLSGSAAVGAGGSAGVAVSGSGVWAENQIGVRVNAGTMTETAAKTRPGSIHANIVSALADNNSRITAFAGAASIAVALGGSVGVSVSIGVSLARNVIDGVVMAALQGVDVTASEGVTVKASSDADIKVFSLAASVSAAIGGAAGVGVSGAGASALNIILADTYAGIDDSAIQSTGDVVVDAVSASRIDATIISASIGVGVGGTVGVGASIGVSIARNYLGYDPYAYSGTVTYVQGTDSPSQLVKGDKVKLGPTSGARANEVYEYIGSKTLTQEDRDKDGKMDDLILGQDFSDKDKWKQLLTTSANEIKAYVIGSSVTIEGDVVPGDLAVSALNRQKIESFVFAGSVAASGGGTVGAALSGAGASATNRINTDTQAYIFNSTGTGMAVDGDILVQADNKSSIESSVLAVSVSAAFGTFAGSVSIGISIAVNEIAGSTKAYADRVVLDAGGDILITALDTPSIDSSSTAVSVAISGGIGFAIAGGGAVSFNTITTQVVAGIDRTTTGAVNVFVEGSENGWTEVRAKGNLTILADSLAQQESQVLSAAASFGLIAAAAAGTVSENEMGALVDAYLSSAVVELSGAGTVVLVKANSVQESHARADALSVSSGASMGFSSASSRDVSIVRAGLGTNTQVTAPTLRVLADSTDNLFQQSTASSGGLFAGLAGAYSKVEILGRTQVLLGDDSHVTVSILDLTANREQNFDATAFNLAVGALAGSGATMISNLVGSADIKIGERV